VHAWHEVRNLKKTLKACLWSSDFLNKYVIITPSNLLA
jgi:hypothetical protein